MASNLDLFLEGEDEEVQVVEVGEAARSRAEAQVAVMDEEAEEVVRIS